MTDTYKPPYDRQRKIDKARELLREGRRFHDVKKMLGATNALMAEAISGNAN